MPKISLTSQQKFLIRPETFVAVATGFAIPYAATVVFFGAMQSNALMLCLLLNFVLVGLLSYFFMRNKSTKILVGSYFLGFVIELIFYFVYLNVSASRSNPWGNVESLLMYLCSIVLALFITASLFVILSLVKFNVNKNK